MGEARRDGSSSSSTLFALVAIDIVGSTATLARDGLRAAVSQRRRLVDLIEAALIDIPGHRISTEGDGSVIGCRSTASALHLAERLRSDVGAAADFTVRIAITIDEVVDNDGERSARNPARLVELEQSASPNEIVIDELVQRAAVGVVDTELERVGDGASQYRLLGLGDDLAGEATELAAVVFTSITSPDDQAATALSLASNALSAQGRIIDTNGPGHVATFRSCVTAVEACADVHAVAADSSVRAGATDRTIAAAAIAVGEVAIGADDEFGRPVVEAARLLELADDATVMSGSVRTLANGAAGPAVDLGVHRLKGLPSPVVVHRLASTGAARPLVDLPPAFLREQRFAFVGRDNDLAQLRSTWREVVRGDLRAAMVSCEEGGGKTRLIREFARDVVGRGATVLYGACDEDLRLPYGAVADALASAAGVDGPVAAAVRGEDTSLAPIFGGVPDAGTVADRNDVFGAVVDTFHRLAELRPVLFVIDDAQWAGRDTIDLLEHVLSDPGLERVLVLIGTRIEALDRGAALRGLWHSTRTTHRIANHRLRRLDETDVVTMLESRAGVALQGPELAFAEQITKVAGGSPLFLEELILHLVSTGVLVRQDRWELTASPDDLPLPDSVVDLMTQRIARLDDDATRLLTIAAVVGSQFDVEVVASVADVEVDDVLDAVESAVAVGLVHEDDNGEVCAFYDELGREALLRELRPSRRARLHRSVAELLERERPSAIDALAHHWQRASGVGARDRAAHFLGVTADRDMAAAAWESAAARLGSVLELAESAETVDDDAIGEIRYRLGSSLRMLGDDRHRDDLLKAARHARSRQNGDLLARCAIAMMRPGFWYSEAGIVDAEVVELCEEALLLLGPEDERRAKVLAVLAINLAYDPDVDRCRSLIEEAQRLARERQDSDAIGTAIAAELIAIQDPAQFERRWALAVELRRIGRLSGDRSHLFTGGFFMAVEHQQRGEIEQAEALIAELRENAEAARSYWYRYLVAHFETMLAIARCEPGARAAVKEQSERAEKAPVDGFGPSVIQEAAIALGEGTLGEMLRPFGEAMEQFDHVEDWATKWNHPIARALAEGGDGDAAVRLIERQALPDSDWYFVSSMCNLAWIGFHLGRRDFCELVIHHLTAHRGRFAVIGLGICVSGHVSTALGQARVGLGDLDGAEKLFREAIAEADAARFPYFATEARRYLATIMLRRDPDAPELSELLTEAEAAATTHGFAAELQALRDLGEQRATARGVS